MFPRRSRWSNVLCFTLFAAFIQRTLSFSSGGSAFATANRNLNLRVADRRLSENITDVNKATNKKHT